MQISNRVPVSGVEIQHFLRHQIQNTPEILSAIKKAMEN
jgi:hypothetical protein